jgi:hypothetical protein
MNQLVTIALVASSLRLTLSTEAVSVPSNSWFREKYLQKSYEEYYEYTVTRYKLEDNDRDVCPDIHKSSLFYAITGQHMNRLSNRCYLHRINSVRYTPPPPPPPDEGLIIPVFDVILYMKKLVYIVTTLVYSLLLIMLFIPFR